MRCLRRLKLLGTVLSKRLFLFPLSASKMQLKRRKPPLYRLNTLERYCKASTRFLSKVLPSRYREKVARLSCFRIVVASTLLIFLLLLLLQYYTTNAYGDNMGCRLNVFCK